MGTSHFANSIELKAYTTIQNEKYKNGKYFKAIFHIHTPASHDFKLESNKDVNWYNSLNAREVYNICIEEMVFPPNIELEAFNNNMFKIYNDVKEALSYLLIANKIMNTGVELAIIADHNTTLGYNKLIEAIEILNENKVDKRYPKIILGVEFSCADRLHIIGIFNDDKETIKSIESWINENTLSIEEGTYRTSHDVIEMISENDGVSYIAHINTSDIFKDNYLSGAYKKKLLEMEELNLIGVSDLDKIDSIKTQIRNITKRKVQYLLDCDSHSYDEIDKNPMWIKGSNTNFDMLKDAIGDYSISIRLVEPLKREKYIKGLYIHTENDDERTFLKDKKSDSFCLTFSEYLNTIIGGRGSGKSTVLNIIEFALSQTSNNERELDFICRHNWLWILYSYENEEYIISLNLPVKERDDESILQYFRMNSGFVYGKKYRFDKDEVKTFTRKELLEVYKVEYRENKLYFNSVASKSEMLSSFFDTSYSVNELVKTASGEDINEFILNKILENDTINESIKIRKPRNKKEMRNLLRFIDKELYKRKTMVDATIDKFNISQDKILRIKYHHNRGINSIKYEAFFNYKEQESYYKNKNILVRNVIEYLYSLEDELGIFETFRLIFEEDYDEIYRNKPIEDYLEPTSKKLIEKNVSIIEKPVLLVENIVKEVTKNGNFGIITESLRDYVNEIEEFALDFNINSKESASTDPVIYKDTRDLSLGQKVVAMLSFILAYSDYSGDFRPLIIDQPEDNLDNQYIYKTLVKQLRKIKEKRQIIIATHNAAIVTNSKAEQVVVMESDNNKGWIRMIGYPTEKNIKKHILNYLEGGVDSFNHKCLIYKDVLTKETK